MKKVKLNHNEERNLKAAIKASILGYERLMDAFGTKQQLISKGGVDACTSLDKELESETRAYLSTSTGIPCFGEEQKGSKTSNYLWILDKIDGTPNFRDGLGQFGSAIALVQGNNCIINAVLLPYERNVYYAFKGRGAFKLSLNNSDIENKLIFFDKSTKLQTTKETDLKKIQIAGDLSYTNRVEKLKKISAYAQEVFYCPLPGSASYGMSKVADGSYGAYWISGVDINDIFPGILLVKEAGGIISDIKGNPITRNSKDVVVAANQEIYDFLIERLNNK